MTTKSISARAEEYANRARKSEGRPAWQRDDYKTSYIAGDTVAREEWKSEREHLLAISTDHSRALDEASDLRKERAELVKCVLEMADVHEACGWAEDYAPLINRLKEENK